MTTRTLTITDFLLARIAEDEWAARQWDAAYNNPGPQPSYHREVMKRHRSEWPTLWRSLDRFPPARVLAECEAKRRIVDRYAEALMDSCSSHDLGFGGAQAALLDALHYLALPYADHRDYRDEWRP